jgi:hypothetical protein
MYTKTIIPFLNVKPPISIQIQAGLSLASHRLQEVLPRCEKKVASVNVHVIPPSDSQSVSETCSWKSVQSVPNPSDALVVSFLGKQWETLVGGSTTTLDCYTEFLHQDGVIFWAHPNYREEGPWYDWATVRFAGAESGEEGDFPCRILLFYEKMEETSESSSGEDTDVNGRSTNQSSIHVIVQATTYRGQVLDHADRTRRNKLQQSHLCTRWLLDSDKARDGTSIPRLYSVPVDAIQENILVVEEEPGLCESWVGNRCIWHVKDRQTQWSHMFPLTFNL